MENKVLIIDDDEIIAKIIKKFLNLLKVEAESVSNGNECLKKIQNTKYKLYFLDLTLPDINGMELAKKIKELDDGSIIIVMSGYLETEISPEYKNYYDDFIYKPDLSNLIIEKTKKYLNL